MNDEPLSDKHRISLASFFSDVTFNYYMFYAAHMHATYGRAPVYVYMFGFEGEWSFPHLYEGGKEDFGGVSHMDDVRYFMR